MRSVDEWEVPPLEWSSFNRRRQREIAVNSESGHYSAHDQKFKKIKCPYKYIHFGFLGAFSALTLGVVSMLTHIQPKGVFTGLE